MRSRGWNCVWRVEKIKINKRDFTLIREMRVIGLYNKLEYCIFIKMIFCSCCRQTGLFICPEMGILQVLTNFASGTSIHGLTFIVQKRLPIWERVTWTLVFIGAMIYASERLHVAIVGKNGKFDFLISNTLCQFNLQKMQSNFKLE